jgi:hypothetical protein
VTVYANDSSGNLGSSTVYFTVDTIPPSINITSPQNTTYEYASPITLTYSASEAVSASYYSLDGGANTSFTNGSTTISPDVGSHNVTFWINDSAGNWGSNTSYFTVVDTTPPGITIVSPQNTTLPDSTPLLNATFGEAVNYTWYSTSTLYGNTNNLTQDLSILSDGPHNVTVYANDSSGNLGSSTVYFTVDTIPPSINITSPQNTTYGDSPGITLSYSASEVVSASYYSLDGGANTSFTNGSTTISPDVGSHNITFWVNDSAGKWGSNTTYFTVEDTSPPSITITSPQNTSYTTSSISMNYSVSDASGTSWAGYSLDGDANVTLNWNTTLYGVSVGQHNLTVYANDTYGNIGSGLVWFTVNRTVLGTYTNTSVNVTTNETTRVDARNTANSTLEIVTSENVTGPVNMTLTSTNPSARSFGVPSLDRYLEINASSNLEANLTYVVIKLYYTDAEVAARGLIESTLGFWWYNETSSEWVELDASMDWVYGTGVNTTANFVWANATHFSIYVIGGDPGGNITGYVKDSTGDPIANVTLVLSNSTNASIAEVNTSADGSYGFIDALEGSYNVTATKTGYVSRTHSATVTVGSSDTVSFALLENKTYTITLSAGWNLMGWPFEEKNFTDALSDITGDYASIWTWNGTSWQTSDPPSIDSGDDFQVLESGKGYYLNIITATNLTINGTLQAVNLSLYGSKWNMFGWPYPETDIYNALESIEGNWHSVWYWDPSTSSWKTAYKQEWSRHNNFNALEPGRGYWIWMYSNDTLELDPEVWLY